MEVTDIKTNYSDVSERSDHSTSVHYEDKLIAKEFADDREIVLEAIGGASSDELQAGYYRSLPLLGTLLGCLFSLTPCSYS
jgi:hypothetical protein